MYVSCNLTCQIKLFVCKLADFCSDSYKPISALMGTVEKVGETDRNKFGMHELNLLSSHVNTVEFIPSEFSSVNSSASSETRNYVGGQGMVDTSSTPTALLQLLKGGFHPVIHQEGGGINSIHCFTLRLWMGGWGNDYIPYSIWGDMIRRSKLIRGSGW